MPANPTVAPAIAQNVKSPRHRPPLLESWFEVNLALVTNMLPQITQCDAGPWLSFFIESRLWQFETVPTFVEGTDKRRCDNEYAAQVFRLFADRSPRLKRISYHMINYLDSPSAFSLIMHCSSSTLRRTQQVRCFAHAGS